MAHPSSASSRGSASQSGLSQGTSRIDFPFARPDYKQSTVGGDVPGLQPPTSLFGTRKPAKDGAKLLPVVSGPHTSGSSRAQKSTKTASKLLMKGHNATPSPSAPPRGILKQPRAPDSPFAPLLQGHQHSPLSDGDGASNGLNDQPMSARNLTTPKRSKTPSQTSRATFGTDGRINTNDSDSEDEQSAPPSRNTQSDALHGDMHREASTLSHGHGPEASHPLTQHDHLRDSSESASQRTSGSQRREAVPPANPRHDPSRPHPYMRPTEGSTPSAPTQIADKHFPQGFGASTSENPRPTTRGRSQPPPGPQRAGGGLQRTNTPHHPAGFGSQPSRPPTKSIQIHMDASRHSDSMNEDASMDPEALTRRQMQYQQHQQALRPAGPSSQPAYGISDPDVDSMAISPGASKTAEQTNVAQIAEPLRPGVQPGPNLVPELHFAQHQDYPQQQPRRQPGQYERQAQPQVAQSQTIPGGLHPPQTPQKPTETTPTVYTSFRGRGISQTPPATPSRSDRPRSASARGWYDDEHSEGNTLVSIAASFQSEMAETQLANAELRDEKEKLQNALKELTAEREATIATLSTVQEAAAKAQADLQQAKGMAGRWVKKYKDQQSKLLEEQEAMTKAAKVELDRVKAAARQDPTNELRKLQKEIESIKDEDGQPKGVSATQKLLGERGKYKQLLEEYKAENGRLIEAAETARANYAMLDKTREELEKLYAKLDEQNKVLNVEVTSLKQNAAGMQKTAKQVANQARTIEELRAHLKRQEEALSEAQAKMAHHELKDVERNGREASYIEKLEQLGVKLNELDGSIEEDDDLVARFAQQVKNEMARNEREWRLQLENAAGEQTRLKAELKDVLGKYKHSKSSLILAEKDREETEQKAVNMKAELVRLREVETKAIESQQKQEERMESHQAKLSARAAGEQTAANLLLEKERDLADAKAAHKTTASHISAKDQEIGKLKGELESQKKKVERLLAEKQNLEGFVGALKDGKPAGDVERAHKLNDLQTTLEATKLQLGEKAEIVRTLQAQADALVREKDELVAKLADTEGRAERAQAASSAERDAEVDQLRTACEAAAAEKAELVAGHKKAMATIKAQVPEGTLSSRYDAGCLLPEETGMLRDIMTSHLMAAFLAEFKKSYDASIRKESDDLANKLKTAEFHNKQLEKKINARDSMPQRGAGELSSTDQTGTDKDFIKMKKDLERAEARILTEKQKFDSSQSAHKADVLRLKELEEDNKRKDQMLRDLEAKAQVQPNPTRSNEGKKAATTPGSKRRRRVVDSDDDDDAEAVSATCGMDGIEGASSRPAVKAVEEEKAESCRGGKNDAPTGPTDMSESVAPGSNNGKNAIASSSDTLTSFSGQTSSFKPPRSAALSTAMLPPASSNRKPRLDKTTSNARIHGSGDPEKLNKQFHIPRKLNGEPLVSATRLATPKPTSTRAPSSRRRKSVNYAETNLEGIEEEEIGKFPSQIDLTSAEVAETQPGIRLKGKATANAKDKSADPVEDIEADEDDEQTMVETASKKSRFDLPQSSSGPSSPAKTLLPPGQVAQADPLFDQFIDYPHSSQEGPEAAPQAQSGPEAQCTQDIDPATLLAEPTDSQVSFSFEVPSSQTQWPMPLTQNPDKLAAMRGVNTGGKRLTRTTSRNALGVIPSSQDSELPGQSSQALQDPGTSSGSSKRKRSLTHAPSETQALTSKQKAANMTRDLKKAGSKSKLSRTRIASSSCSRVLSSQVEEDEDELDGAGYDDSEEVRVVPEGRKVKKAKTRKI